MQSRKVGFPHMGNYFVAYRPLLELLGDEVMVPPSITKQTIELGYKHSPESACIPFKYNLGNYIEVLEGGANLLVQAGGGCRFGYYGEVQAEILRKLGYEFEFLKLTNTFNPFGIIKNFKSMAPEAGYLLVAKRFYLSYIRLRVLDRVEEYVRKNIGFEAKAGSFKSAFNRFLDRLNETKSAREARRLQKETLASLKSLPIDKPQKPIRVAIVGELYVLMEPFSNFYLEKQLADKGIEVHRFCTVSSILHGAFSMGLHERKMVKLAGKYLKHHIGAHGSESVALARQCMQDGFDGIIHIKPFGCMPEVNAMSALHRMSSDYKFPMIYFSFDAQTSETGLKTRLEAFYDMLIMKRKKQYAKQPEKALSRS